MTVVDFRSFVTYEGQDNYIEVNIAPFKLASCTYFNYQDWLVIEIPTSGYYDKFQGGSALFHDSAKMFQQPAGTYQNITFDIIQESTTVIYKMDCKYLETDTYYNQSAKIICTNFLDNAGNPVI